MTLLGGCAAGLVGAAAPAAAKEAVSMLTLTDQDDGRRVSLHPGDVLEVRLTENATTGYRWTPDTYDAALLELAETSASYPGAAVGSGGVAIFQFRAVGKGSGVLALKYWRHWEGAGSVAQRFTATVDVAP